MEQMYLDLGQSNFAKPTICNMCGMLYVHGLSEDATQHDRICQDYQLVKRVRTIVEKDLGFHAATSSKNQPRTAYLYVRNKRVVGFANAEVLSQAHVMETLQVRSNTTRKAMVGIHQLWVHAKERNQGIATRLMDAVRASFIFGLVIPVEMLAFSSPTAAGASFARRYVQSKAGKEDCPLLVYDCV